MSANRPKIANVMNLVRARAQVGDFVILPHAMTRRKQRQVSVPDIVYILVYGAREPDKDEFKESFDAWNYAIRGSTVDGRQIRIAVAFDETNMLIITVIPLGSRRS